MAKHQKPDNKKHARTPNGRPTIGFLNASGLQFFHQAWRGVADVAREHNINAISFIGQYVRDTKGFKAQANILYDLIDAVCLDGLVIQDLMCNMLDPDEAQQFYERYRPLPMVSIGRRRMEGIPCVQSGGYEGMRKAIVHLIEVHGRHRIAFIKGLPNYQPLEERYQAYVDVLTEYGLPFDPARVAVPHDAAEAEQPDWGRVALCRLLDEQEADIDALVTNDDRFAHNLLPELQVRGFRVPDDIALVSFDDEEGSNCLTPPLTTVPIPIYEMGRQAAETLVAKLKGQEVLDQVVDVPSDRLIVRQSCGCLDPNVTQVVAGPVVKIDATKPLKASLVEQQENIVAQMRQEVERSVIGLPPDWAEQLLDSFVTALTTALDEEAPDRFLSTLDDILRQVMAADGDIGVWQRVLSTLRRQILPYLSIDETGTLSRDRVEDLWLQAQAMIGGVVQRALAYRELQAERQRRILNEIGSALATNFDVDDLAEILARELPRLGISRGYLSLYEKPQPYRYPQPVPEWSRLVVAYDEAEPAGSSRVAFEEDERRFLSRQLVPPEILPQHEPYNLIVQALYFRNEQIGFSAVEDGPDEGAIYELLRGQISSALKGNLLYQEVQQARLVAEKADRIKTRLLANVSHELRTPLNVILGYSRDALGAPNPYGITPPQSLLDDLEHIHNNAKHQLRVVNDLLDLSRAEIEELDLYLELLDPCPLLHDAFDNISHSMTESNLAWQLELPDRLPLVQADPVRLRQILLNLLSNACKFTSNGEIVLGVQVEPPHLHLWVQDTGEGISPDMQERIFEPFVTTEHISRRPDGIGLGLSITRHLVALHGGSMKLESQPGCGSTFHVYLPLPNLADKTTPVTDASQPVLLLITAMDQPVAEIVELCHRQGLDIHRLHAGDDLDAVLSNVQPAALAWDLAGASANHWAMVRRIHNHPRLSQLPFILYGQGQAAKSSIGLTGVVTKPINAPTLLDAIAALSPQEMTGPILIVDDDPVARQEHQDMISQGFPGYPVCVVNDGAAALAAMDDQIPSLVLLDLMMPEMDGFAVLDRMRTNPHTQAVPVVILTSKVLNLEDIKRIEQHTGVVLQSKGVLADDEIVAALHRSLFGAESLPPQTSMLVKRAVAYMHQNYTRPLARWEISEAIGASENYFSRLFNQELGLSPWEYLNRFRVCQAKELFRRTQGSVKSIACQVGFKDPKYFSRVFRKQTDLSPSEFREQSKPRISL
jgi:signal transduction histidine kinase/DNA-binding LacI/PurR family transcriptional regulator/AraC-like DNA-binding protein